MARVDGTIARLALPDWQGAHVQLSIFFFPFTLKRVREALEGARSGVHVLELSAPVNAPTIELALDGRSLYVLGWREKGKATWSRFRVDAGAPPVLPGGRHRDVGTTGNYMDLPAPDRYRRSVMALLGSLARPAGEYDPADVKLMLLLAPEALRFQSAMEEGMRFLSNGVAEFAAIRQELYWEDKTRARSRDVLLPHLP
jgi:hypothetical protein